MAATTEHTTSPSPPPQPGAPKGVIRRYDFRRPDKFSKDHLRTLRVLHETFARLLASSLTSYARTNVQVRLTSVEQVSYDDHVRSLPRPTVLYVMSLSPLPGQAVAQIDLPLARSILERLLGGPGELDDRDDELTEIEVALLGTLANSLRLSLEEAWAQVYPLQVTISDPVFNSEFVQVALPAETTAVLTLEVSMAMASGTLTLGFPHPVLQPVVEQLTAELRFSGAVKDETGGLDLADPLTRVSVPVVAELGRAHLTLSELLSLSPGRVIKLDTSAKADIAVRIADVVKFTAKPGIQGKNMAIQITSIVD